MNSPATTDYLSAYAFFVEISEDDLAFMCECSSTHEIKKERILFRQGDSADKFYVVRKGRISLQIPAIMGPTLDIQTLGKDQVLGWSWLISAYKWNFQTKAEEDSELLQFEGPHTGTMRAGAPIWL
ncbi:MAG: cyclic nucleotide-binding domain-containing protein [Methylococcales bacterium]|nr:cyclic nucleotide-binding domain-containing protein [Methylococcales bacterium]